ncbi:type II toxin-antitoxin system HicA family toxin [Lentilactobacillus parabuchneri]|nr:type II toxin-antitoxin system HicA family toxin [Lentilactobacillus parabuchneri]
MMYAPKRIILFGLIHIVVYNTKHRGRIIMPMTPKEMIELLRQNGFVRKRQRKSSHLIMFNPQTKITVPVPMHAKELKKGTQSGILKQAGIKKV